MEPKTGGLVHIRETGY